jgi:hypothetical protein
MRERLGLIVKLACYGLVALLVFNLSGVVLRLTRASVTIPALPALSDDSSAKGTNAAPAAGTNLAAANAAATRGTNKSPVASSTNLVSSTNVVGTNVSLANVSIRSETKSTATNLAKADTKAEVHLPTRPRAELEQGTVTMSVPSMTEKGSNAVRVLTGTNEQSIVAIAGTNAGPRRPGTEKGTNAPSARDLAMAKASSRSSASAKAPDLAPPIKARINRIVESEILGPVVRPMPMALIGIAGSSAIIRSPSGQTSWVKEGDEVGGVKLLQIGINRVIVEEQGQKKELTIFSGFGSESLLAKPKETSDETTHK